MHPVMYEIIYLILGLVTDDKARKQSGEYQMSIKSFDQKFTLPSAQKAPESAQKPKAQLWLNLGYTIEGAGKEGEDVFVSLPTGIPLDTQEPVQTNVKSEDFRALRSAQNDLLSDLLKYAEGLEPGQETIINLQVQLRRVKGDEAPIAPAENKYARPIQFGG